MTLKCQSMGVKCPSYDHQGFFKADNDTVKSFFPDLSHCATCMSQTPPKRTDLEEDMFQVAALTLIDKGPRFNPGHESGASFRNFIRVRICGALMDAKKREIKQSLREVSTSYVPVNETRETAAGSVLQFPDPQADFEDRLAEDLSFASALPDILKILTPGEQKVFTYLREDWQNHEIASVLNLSKGRVSQLVKQVIEKLATTGQRLGLNA